MGLFSATTADSAAIQEKYRDIFMDGETVDVAFRTVRDTVFLTDRRIVFADVQGLTGKKVAFTTIPYRAIVQFTIATAGTFDLDAELVLTLSGGAVTTLKVSRGADIGLLQRTLVRHMTGGGKA